MRLTPSLSRPRRWFAPPVGDVTHTFESGSDDCDIIIV